MRSRRSPSPIESSGETEWLSPYRAALRDLTGLMRAMNREEKRRLLGYLIEKVVLGDGGVTLYLRSETLEAPNVNHPEGKYPPGGEWLPLSDSNRRHSD